VKMFRAASRLTPCLRAGSAHATYLRAASAFRKEPGAILSVSPWVAIRWTSAAALALIFKYGKSHSERRAMAEGTVDFNPSELRQFASQYREHMNSNPQKQILIVEDSPDLQALLGQLLFDEGYAVKSSMNGQEAFDYLRARKDPQPDLILLDIMMPVMDGLVFRDVISQYQEFANIPVIFITADSHSEAKVQTDKKTAYLKKPIDLEQLLKKVKEFCS